MEMMRSGSTCSRVVMGLVHCTIVDSDSDSEIEAYPENCGAPLLQRNICGYSLTYLNINYN